MKLRPGFCVADVSAAGEFNRTKPIAPNEGATAPEDGVLVSTGLETLGLLKVQQAIKVARITAAVQNGTYQVDSAALGKAILEDAVR